MHQFAAAHYRFTGALHLENLYGALAARDAHIFGEEQAWRTLPVVTSARRNLMCSSRTGTLEKAPGDGDSPWIWLRTVSALCVQSISASFFLILCA
jgi:hypothetical protein